MSTAVSDHPNVARIIEIIGRQNPLQRKRISAFVSTQGSEYWEFAESLSRTLNERLLRSDESAQEAARSYNRMCMDFVNEQIRFKKTGRYSLDDAAVAHDEVYSRPDVMRYYMIGLLLSYMFWPNHYAMLRFLDEHLRTRAIAKYLEIAPGHGLFTARAVRRSPRLRGMLVDISPTALEVSRSILEAFEVDLSRLDVVRGDFLEVDLGETEFDFISMGEVLEHVNEADVLLARAARLLTPDGAIFMTTCANCPALDHVYHFHNVREIRELIAKAGLAIGAEMALPSEPFPEEVWERELVTINYCCILTPA
ncbi:MAG: class I SAM-dependent methyltransferase [Chloroflexi bacterium]|nr:class I SAM-dependent methyltransferase [Chloroflexota bacterium]